MSFIFEITDKTERKIHLSKERWRHILNHPRMDENQLENIQLTITKPLTIRCNEEDATVRYFYKYFRHMDVAERYLLVSVKYLNGEGFIITSFFTNKITGSKWKTK